ncbi:hypothetical protein P7D22_14025 [Lichenihabitans sp. Uapishka_5]|nr:hypothetical protein [Lichenihabitans sp. Uapishka_5]
MVDAICALAYDYLRAGDAEGIDEDQWAFDALLAAADQRTWPLRPSAMPHADEGNAAARKRAFRHLLAAARDRDVALPDNVHDVLKSWAERNIA